MNEILKKRIKMIAFFGTITAISFTLMAKPVFKTVKAYLNPGISYTLDGEKVLEGVKTLTYDNKTYVPLADVARLMGLQTKFENNTVSMTTTPTGLTIPVTTGGAYTVTPEGLRIVDVPKATIKEVKVESKTIAILKEGVEDKNENYIILNISDATKIVHEKETKTYALIDLKADMIVSVKYTNVATSSSAVQTVASEIKILTQDIEEDKEVLVVSEEAKILEVNNGEKYIVIETKEGQLKLSFDNKTKIKYDNAKKQPNINALKAGQIVDIKLEKTTQGSDEPTFKIIEIMVKDK